MFAGLAHRRRHQPPDNGDDRDRPRRIASARMAPPRTGRRCKALDPHRRTDPHRGLGIQQRRSRHRAMTTTSEPRMAGPHRVMPMPAGPRRHRNLPRYTSDAQPLLVRAVGGSDHDRCRQFGAPYAPPFTGRGPVTISIGGCTKPGGSLDPPADRRPGKGDNHRCVPPVGMQRWPCTSGGSGI